MHNASALIWLPLKPHTGDEEVVWWLLYIDTWNIGKTNSVMAILHAEHDTWFASKWCDLTSSFSFGSINILSSPRVLSQKTNTCLRFKPQLTLHILCVSRHNSPFPLHENFFINCHLWKITYNSRHGTSSVLSLILNSGQSWKFGVKSNSSYYIVD